MWSTFPKLRFCNHDFVPSCLQERGQSLQSRSRWFRRWDNRRHLPLSGSERCRALSFGSTHGQGCLKLLAEETDSSVSAKLTILYRKGGGQLQAGQVAVLCLEEVQAVSLQLGLVRRNTIDQNQLLCSLAVQLALSCLGCRPNGPVNYTFSYSILVLCLSNLVLLSFFSHLPLGISSFE